MNYYSFPYAGVIFPSESPFYPLVRKGGSKVRFNQGYIIDYQKRDAAAQAVSNLKIGGMDQEFDLTKGLKFIVKINTSTDTSSITSASFEQSVPSMTVNFHYSAAKLDGERKDVYKDEDGTFQILACEFERGQGEDSFFIKEVFLRENIHWQKTNFSNTTKETDSVTTGVGVLRNWGGTSSDNSFNDNPSVQFKRLVQLESGKDQVIKLTASPNGENIAVTTQIPPSPSGARVSVLYRDDSDTGWNWAAKSGSTDSHILVAPAAGKLSFFETTNGGVVYAMTAQMAENTPVEEGVPAVSAGDLALAKSEAATSTNPTMLYDDGDKIYFGLGLPPNPKQSDMIYFEGTEDPTGWKAFSKSETVLKIPMLSMSSGGIPNWIEAPSGSGSGGTGSLPEGSEGQMLYHNETGWTAFGPAPDPELDKMYVLRQSGMEAPNWHKLEKFSIDLCDGTTTKTYELWGEEQTS